MKVEIEEIQKKYGDARRTAIASDAGEAEYTAEDFIVEEDNVVIVSRDGWVKRQKEVKDVSTTRVREGDACWRCFPEARAPRWSSSATSAWPTLRGSSTFRRRPATASRYSASSS